MHTCVGTVWLLTRDALYGLRRTLVEQKVGAGDKYFLFLLPGSAVDTCVRGYDIFAFVIIFTALQRCILLPDPLGDTI